MTSIKDALEPFARIPLAHTDDIDDGATVFEYEGGSITLGDLRRVNEALATLTTPTPGRDALRERIARLQRDILMYIDAGCPDDDIGYIVKVSHINLVQWYDALDAILSALPVAPVVDEAAIRADEREKCARIAESEALSDKWPLHPNSERMAPSRRMQLTIAQAIRAGGGER